METVIHGELDVIIRRLFLTLTERDWYIVQWNLCSTYYMNTSQNTESRCPDFPGHHLGPSCIGVWIMRGVHILCPRHSNVLINRFHCSVCDQCTRKLSHFNSCSYQYVVVNSPCFNLQYIIIITTKPIPGRFLHGLNHWDVSRLRPRPSPIRHLHKFG